MTEHKLAISPVNGEMKAKPLLGFVLVVEGGASSRPPQCMQQIKDTLMS